MSSTRSAANADGGSTLLKRSPSASAAVSPTAASPAPLSLAGGSLALDSLGEVDLEEYA